MSSSSVLHRIRTVSIRRWTGGSRCYWKQNFFIVFLPFIVLGVPIHALIFDFKKCKSRRRPLPTHRSTNKNSSDTVLWLKSLFASPLATILTVILFAVCVYVNYRIVYVFVKFFDTLVVQGKILAHTFGDLVNFLILAPLIVLTDFLWLSGQGLKMRIKSFDRTPLYLEEKLKFTVNSNDFYNNNNNNNRINSISNNVILDSSNSINNSGLDDSAKMPQPTCRMKMGLLYFMVFAFHSIRVFILAQTWISEKWEAAEIEQFWISSVATIFFSLMMPIYSCLCWAIFYQQQTLHAFIEQLIKRKIPLNTDHLIVVKSAYKNVADSIVHMNDLCSFYISYVILAFGLPVLYQNRSVALYLVGNIIGSTLLQLDADLTSKIVRTFVGQTMVLVLLLVLIVFTVWQAVQVNDSMRYFHVWLNDLAASQVDHHLGRHQHQHRGQGQMIMDNEIYHAFCLLKYYVHSRMEQEQPALMVISFIYFFPGLEGRLERYNVLH